MHPLSVFTLKALRDTYAWLFSVKKPVPDCIQDPDTASEMIYRQLMSDRPCMVARFGSDEMWAMVNYLGVKNGPRSIWKYIKGEELDWWWHDRFVNNKKYNSTFTLEMTKRFSEMMIHDASYVDILGSWLHGETYFEKEMQNCQKLYFEYLSPYFAKMPWTKALENKKVLVVSAFSRSVELQYQKRELLFENKDILPPFELKVYQAVYGVENSPYSDWFDALEGMKKGIDQIDYDICLLGCGRFGFPLAAHIKRKGKKAVHLGGSIQLLFGIRGKRWENPNYQNELSQGFAPVINYAKLMNEHWVRPRQDETPSWAKKVEGGCYW